MRQQEKKRRSIGIRGQLMWFLCLICLLLLGMFWFLSTQLLEPLYTKHIQKQLTEEADLIVTKMDEAIASGTTLSYWAFGGIKVTNEEFFNQLGSEIYSGGELSSFCVDISDATLRTIKNMRTCPIAVCIRNPSRIRWTTTRSIRRPVRCASTAARTGILPACSRRPSPRPIISSLWGG